MIFDRIKKWGFAMVIFDAYYCFTKSILKSSKYLLLSIFEPPTFIIWDSNFFVYSEFFNVFIKQFFKLDCSMAFS